MCRNDKLAGEHVARKTINFLNNLKYPSHRYYSYKMLVGVHLREISKYCYTHCKFKESCPNSIKIDKFNQYKNGMVDVLKN